MLFQSGRAEDGCILPRATSDSLAMLRNEDYVAFLDESGEPGLQVVGGLLVPARWLRSAERRWADFIRHNTGSISGRAEVHATDLYSGRGLSLHAQAAQLAATGTHRSAKAAGRTLYRDILEHVAGIAEVRVIAVGMNARRANDVYRLWYWMTYSALIVRPRAPRPRLAMVVIDGEDAAYRRSQDLVAHRFYSHFSGRQPYLRRGRSWFVGGAVHQQSELLPFIQMADVVTNSARHAIAGNSRARSWFDTHLRQHALNLTPRRDVDVSAHALAQLRRRSPADGCGSGHAQALLVP